MPIGHFTSTDDFHHGTVAAAFGGTTAIVDFVETGPDETMVEALAARQAKAQHKAVVDYGLHMTITPSDIGRLDQVPHAYAAGCASFKLYMAYGLRLDDGQLLEALEAIAAVGGLPVVHAENWDVITTLVRRNLANGRTSPHWHPRSRPALMESEAAARVIDLAELVGSPLHIFHVSCAATAERIAAAKARGRPVTGETCPQYLYLTDEAYDRPGVEGALPVCAPPLRPKADQEALWTALREGTLDLVSTDHCPFTKEEKAGGLHDFSQIPGGVPSIESRLAPVFAGLMGSLRNVNTGEATGWTVGGYRHRSQPVASPLPVTGHLPASTCYALSRWVDLCCTTPARLLRFGRKGHIAPGYDADLVIFDPAREFTIRPEPLHETAGWTPYEGLTLRGWPEVTISRGEVIVENGRFLGSPGRGRYVHRQ
jgi:dihydropyrimidinase